MENRNDIALQQKLDKQQYASRELIEVRVPVTLPYMNDWSQFESYEGETTINGHRRSSKLAILAWHSYHSDRWPRLLPYIGLPNRRRVARSSQSHTSAVCITTTNVARLERRSRRDAPA